MTTLEAVVAACIESGTLSIAFLALVILPLAIWMLSRLALRWVREIGNDRVRALFAGSLAIAPGASFAVASVVVIARAVRAGCLEMPGGRIVVAAVALLLALAFVRAIVRTRKRLVEVDRMTRIATTAEPRLAAVAAFDSTLPVREIDSDEPLIFVGGSLRPTIYVSSGALALLSDIEIRAALAHERAHARHGDHVMMAALLFCCDLVPLGVRPLTDLYRDAREFAADQAAIETADPLDLASAILRVVSPRRERIVAALAEACVKARLSWLLSGAGASDAAFPSALNYLVIAQLALICMLAVAALVFPGCRTALKHLFLCVYLLSIVALPLGAAAASITQPLGSAMATLTLDPDPPTTGTAHATLDITSASAADLATTTISYGTEMTSMHMAGGGGTAHPARPGHYTFDVSFGMADTWGISIHAEGGVTGTASFTIPVATPSAARPATSLEAHEPSAASAGVAASRSMAGMAMGSSTGDAGPWRTAALVLLALIITGAIVSRRVRTPWAYAVLCVAGAVAIGVAALQAHVDAQPGSMNGMDMNAMTDVKGDAPVPVRTVALAIASASSDAAIYAPGTLAPYFLQDIVARSSGVLDDLTTYAGDRVSAGQVLAHLNEPELAARAGASSADANAQSHAADAAAIDATSRAPANVVVSQAAANAATVDAQAAAADVTSKNERRRYWATELGRERSLLREGAVSQQDYQDERAQAAAADADATMAGKRLAAAHENAKAAAAKILDASATAQIARANASSMRAQAEKAAQSARTDAVMAGYANVVAPMDGIVLKRMVDPGTYVQAGTIIARVAVIDRLRVQANIADTDLSTITVGTPISAKSSDGVTLNGRVSSVAPVADPATRTAAVEAIVANPAHRAVVGGYVRVTIRARASKLATTLRVPSSAIVTGTEQAAVWRVTDRTAERVPVRVVSDDGRNAYITGHLHPGDRIVVDGAPNLQQGAHVSEASP